jgi:hypothetical protein
VFLEFTALTWIVANAADGVPGSVTGAIEPAVAGAGFVLSARRPERPWLAAWTPIARTMINAVNAFDVDMAEFATYLFGRSGQYP